ncbi:MAG: DNA replication/repair protein RecF [Defluviitaleaceae bacterium]|nr:DNA replication/repair protein RecF [Defluviitaleaceae bacterium]
MWVRTISASNYRNLSLSNVEFSPGINILYGDNAQGKTNILEAVYFCALGRSSRADNNRELVRFGLDEAHVRVEANRDDYSFVIDSHIQICGNKSIKTFSIDRVVVKNTRELFGRLMVVLFSPEDLRLIKAGPAERRRFMDMEICQLSPVYYSDLRDYHRALKQRNNLLKILRKDRKQIDMLPVWGQQLSTHGQRIMRTRSAFVNKISAIAKEIHSHITDGKEELSLTYQPNVENSEDYSKTMEKAQDKDILCGTTSVGIHKDDIIFTINGIPARSFGSQGQQRTAALSAKLAEIEIMRDSAKSTPILLLDDVLSELDGGRQKFLLTQITDLQTIITCTGLEDVLAKNVNDANIMRVMAGKIDKNGF